MELIKQREDLLKYYNRAYDEKLMVGTSGNASAYDEKSGIMLVTPSGIDRHDIDLKDLVAMKLDGTIVDGTYKPSSEWKMHAEIYKAKPDAKSILHTHSPYATALSVTGTDIPLILVEMVYALYGDVKVTDFAIQGTDDVGIKAVEKLKDRTACIIRNHGVVAIGNSGEESFVRAQYVEEAAFVYCIAKGVGEVHAIPQDVQEAMKKSIY